MSLPDMITHRDISDIVQTYRSVVQTASGKYVATAGVLQMASGMYIATIYLLA